MFEDNYLSDLNIDFSSLKHKIAKKALLSYQNYSLEPKEIFDQMNTIYYLMNTQLDVIVHNIKEKQKMVFDVKSSKYLALTIIILNSNILFNELLHIVALSNKSFLLNQIFRQIIEYFTIFNVILKENENVSAIYLNHLNVLEYNAVKSRKEYIDKDLSYAYLASIRFFASYHNLVYDLAEKKYAEPYGWAFGLFKDELSSDYEYISQKKIRELVFKEFFSISEIDSLNRYIKTAEAAVHPTSLYLFQLNSIDTGDSGYRNNIFYQSIKIYSAMLLTYRESFNHNSNIYKLVEYSINIIDKLPFESISVQIEIESDFIVIDAYNKSSCKYYNPIERANFILSDLKNNIGALIPFKDSLHYLYFSLDEFEEIMYQQLDSIYAIFDSFYRNVYSFFPEVLPKSQKLENLRYLIWILSYLHHEIAVAYAFKNVVMLQKIFRQFIEYAAVTEKLLVSSEDVNKAFYEISFVLLNNTIFEDENYLDVEQHRVKIIELLKLKNQTVFDKISDYFGWTAHYNKNNRLVLTPMNEIVKSFISKVDKGSGYLKIVWRECNAVMHAGGYANEINNDLYNNKFGIIDYIVFMHLIALHTLNNVKTFIKECGNKKLEDSMIEIMAGLIRNKTDFEKYIEIFKNK